jgi:trehalose 6-phosphate phosphatase
VTLPDPLIAVVRHPAQTAVVCDFDGTLAPIVADAATARPVPTAERRLARLATALGRVAVVSGRPVSFLRERLPDVGPCVRLVGLYGMERLEDGRPVLIPEVASWMPVIEEVVAAARRQAPAGVVVEDKRVSVTLHWRRAADRADWCLASAREWATEHGLVVQPARMAVELRPPVAVDKGTAVAELVAGHRVAVYAGDDAGDLAAFDALDAAAAAGAHVVRVAVAGSESPPELARRADLVVPDPETWVAHLAALADAIEAGAVGADASEGSAVDVPADAGGDTARGDAAGGDAAGGDAEPAP